MNTDALINALSMDNRRTAMPLTAAWWAALACAVLLAAAVFFLTLGPRPDIAEAANTPRFGFKFVVTLALAAGAFIAARRLSRPDVPVRRAMPWLAAAPLLVIGAVCAELSTVPSSAWAARLIGSNSLLCLSFIPLIGSAPLGMFLLALRNGAPSHPAIAGMVAGLLAAGVGATFYAAHCPDDSPLFVATWYTIATAILVLVGAITAPRVARW